MNREFLELYNRELALLYENAGDFAEEYPGIAERLGGLTRERADPMMIGLLEGAAMLAARVQLKLKHEFPEFTSNLIDQLLPNYLAPVPSVMLAQINPTFGDPDLREGRTVPRGAHLDAVYREKEQNISCCYTLCNDITYWPFELTRADYYSALGPLQALRVEVNAEAASGLRLNLKLRTAERSEDEPAEEEARKDPASLFSGCTIDNLKVYLVGPEAEAIALYEQLFSCLNGIHLRYLDSFGDPKVINLPVNCLQQIGFDENDTLFPYDTRVFSGFNFIHEFFMFPRKFLGFRLTGLSRFLSAVHATSIDLVMTFSQSSARLAAAVKPSMFSLFAAPAINLFLKNSDRVQIKSSQHEYHVVPDRSQYLNFEPHRVIDVFLHYPGRAEKKRIMPLYRAQIDTDNGRDILNYSIRRLQRKRTSDERRFGARSEYVGTDMFISLTTLHQDEEAQAGEGRGELELSVRAMCSNRHLTEHLPVGQGGADFRFRENTALEVVAAIAPLRPREALIVQKHDSAAADGMGPTAWRLVNTLSLNHLGLTQPDGSALREILSMFADGSDNTTERRIRGVRSIKSRPVIRRLQQRTGVGAARGIEVIVTLEEKAFEGSGVFLLGAVLDRFFAEYAAVNHFTTTVIQTQERGVIARWPARSGSRREL
jgi:type VI secretion system protein ImpG